MIESPISDRFQNDFANVFGVEEPQDSDASSREYAESVKMTGEKYINALSKQWEQNNEY